LLTTTSPHPILASKSRKLRKYRPNFKSQKTKPKSASHGPAT
jgi:hypothetical protein